MVVSAALLAALWQPAACVRIQDGMEGDTFAPDRSVDSSQGYPVSLLSSGNSTINGTESTPSPWRQDPLFLTIKAHLAGSIDLSSIDNLALNLGFEYVEAIDGPPILLKAMGAGGTKAMTKIFEKVIRMRLYAAQGRIHDGLKMVKDRIRETLLNVDNVFVTSMVGTNMRNALAETGIDLISSARIGFKRKDDSFGPVIEIPWTKAKTAAQFCAGATEFGAVTFLAFLPWAILSGCVAACTFKKAAVAVLVVGTIMSTPVVLKPACDSTSMSMLSVPPIKHEINISEMSQVAVDAGLPEMFGIETSWDDDAFRIYASYINETTLKNFVNAFALGKGMGPIIVKDMNLDISLNGYTIEIFPSTYAMCDLDWIKAKEIRDTVEYKPPQKQCTCIRKIMGFCPYKKKQCFYRIKHIFSGTVHTDQISDMGMNTELLRVESVNAPKEIDARIKSGDPAMMATAENQFSRNMAPVEASLPDLQRFALGMIEDILKNNQTFTYTYFAQRVPDYILEDLSSQVQENINQSRLHFTEVFDPKTNESDAVIITVEIPIASARVGATSTAGLTAALCERMAEQGSVLWRMLPFAIVALALAQRFPRVACAVAVAGIVVASNVVTRVSCNQIAPGVVSAQHAGYEVDTQMANSTLYTDVDFTGLKIEPTIGFHTTFDKDLFKIVFNPLKRKPLDELANHFIMTAGENDADLVKKDQDREEFGKTLVSAETRVVFDGYAFGFSSKSWLASNGVMEI